MKRIARSAIVECSADDFYALVEDIESYPSFLPWCAAAAVRERVPGRTVATLTLAVKGLRQSFTTANENRPGRAIDMRLVEGPFRHFAAQWRFTPLQERAVKVEFAVEYAFTSRIVASLLDPLFGRLADDTVEAFARRAAARGRMASIRVEVVFAAAAAADRVVLELPEGSGAGEAARLSGLAARHGLDAAAMILGIAGRKIPADHALTEGDRVEILRPLLADPKEARRRRARTFRGRRGG